MHCQGAQIGRTTGELAKDPGLKGAQIKTK